MVSGGINFTITEITEVVRFLDDPEGVIILCGTDGSDAAAQAARAIRDTMSKRLCRSPLHMMIDVSTAEAREVREVRR